MKKLIPLFCIALIACPMGAQAAAVNLSGGLGLGVVIALGGGGEPREHVRFDRDQRDRRDDGENRTDPRIRVAMAIAARETGGEALNAWPQGGALFRVRVAANGKRFDVIVDVDAGRIVG